MSLKSFDKFCENLILGESGSQKAVYDERQNQIRTKLNVEALMVFGTAVLANTIVMETMYQWSESFSAPMVVIVSLCYIYWIIRNSVKGSLFGVGNNSAPLKLLAGISMFEGVAFGSNFYTRLTEEGFFAKDGMISDTFLFSVAYLLFFASGPVILLLYRRYKKRIKAEAEATAED